MPTAAKRGIAWWLTLLVLLVSGAQGVYNGLIERGDAETALQQSIAYAVIAYGVFGLLGAYGMVRAKRWAAPMGLLWAISATYAAAIAPLAFAPEAPLVGTVSSGVVTALIGWGVVRTIRVGLRQLPEEMPR